MAAKDFALSSESQALTQGKHRRAAAAKRYSTLSRHRNDPPILQRQDTVCAVKNSIVVGHKQCGRAARGPHAFEQVDHIGSAILVEGRSRLIGEHQRWVADKRTGNRDALFLATRQVRREVIDPVR